MQIYHRHERRTVPPFSSSENNDAQQQKGLGRALLYLSGMIAFTWIFVVGVMASRSLRFRLVYKQDWGTEVILVAGVVSMGILWLLERQLAELTSSSIIDEQQHQEEDGTSSSPSSTVVSQDANHKEKERNAFVLLGLFTIGQSVVVAVPCAVLAELGLAPLVVDSMGITLFLFAGLTVFAMQTKYDFTVGKGMMLMGLQGFLLWSWSGFEPGSAMILGSLVLFMLYVMIAVQEVVRKSPSRPDSKAVSMLAAVKLYSGFLNIFLRILHMMVLSKLNNEEQRRKRRNW